MILSNFTYKPRNITQILESDFEECGFNFKDYISKILSAKNEEVTPFPEDQSLMVHISAIDRYNAYLAQFRFNITSESHGNRRAPRLYLNFPKREFEYANENSNVERGIDNIFSEKSFPNSMETIGYCFGNFHINAVFADLFDDGEFSINFDTEGNYLPLSSCNYDCVYRRQDICHSSLSYPAEMDPYNPKDLDKMFIPEISSPLYGSYAFWLDRFHIVAVRDMNRMGSHASSYHCEEYVMKIYTSNSFLNILGDRYKGIYEEDRSLGSIQKNIDKLLEPGSLYYHNENNSYWREQSKFGLTRDGLFSYYKDDDNRNHSGRTSFVDISTLRTMIYPIERKGLEILEAVNANPERFIKQTLFPSSAKKIADATAPLVSLTSQIVRSCKAFAMEEV